MAQLTRLLGLLPLAAAYLSAVAAQGANQPIFDLQPSSGTAGQPSIPIPTVVNATAPLPVNATQSANAALPTQLNATQATAVPQLNATLAANATQLNATAVATNVTQLANTTTPANTTTQANITAAALARTQDVSDFLVFDKQTITLDESSLGVEVNVALKQAPAPGKRVRVFYDGANVRFNTGSKCFLEFTSENFQTAQKIQMFGVPFQTIADKDRDLPLRFQLYGDGRDAHPANGKFVTLPCRRGRGASGRCEVTGDPHFRTFDQNGKIYHYQGEGDYTLISSDLLTVQARHGPCFTKATCIYALAIRYGNTAFVMDGTSQDPNKVLLLASKTMEGVTVSQSNAGKLGSFNLAFSDGSNAKIDMASSGKVRYLNTFFDVAPRHKGKARGMCGTFNDNADDDFTGPDGKVFSRTNVIAQSDKDVLNIANDFKNSELFQFGESWRVPDNQNIFKCGANCQGFSNAEGLVNTQLIECQVPQTTPFTLPPPITRPCAPTGFSQIIQFNQYNINQQIVIINAPAQRSTPSDRDLQVALGGCTEKIKPIAGCEQLDDIQQRIAACEADIRGLMNPDAVYETHRLAYTDRCSRIIVSRANEPNTQIAIPAQEAAQRGCFGNFPCDNQCAVCTSRGCLECKDTIRFEPQGGRCVPRVIVPFNQTVFSPPPQPIPAPQQQAPPVKPTGIEGIILIPGSVQGVPLPAPAKVTPPPPVGAPVVINNPNINTPAPAAPAPAAPATNPATSPAADAPSNAPVFGMPSIEEIMSKCPSLFSMRFQGANGAAGSNIAQQSTSDAVGQPAGKAIAAAVSMVLAIALAL